MHLIADEIMTGFGRTGTMFACEQAGVTPDSACRKASPEATCRCRVLATDAVFDAFTTTTSRAVSHSHSYTGNALACRALAVLDIFRDDDVIAVNRDKASRWRNIASPLAAHQRVRNLRQCGMIVAFDAQTDRPGFAPWFAARALESELLLRPIGNAVYFMPPYVVTDAEFALLVERTLAILDECPA